MPIYYKVTHRGGRSFHGDITYQVGETVHARKLRRGERPKLCSDTVLHASRHPIQALGYAPTLDVSLWEVRGRPVVKDDTKRGFRSLTVVRRMYDLDTAFGFVHSEALHPIHPADVGVNLEGTATLLKEWATARDSVWYSSKDSVWKSTALTLLETKWNTVWGSVVKSVCASVEASVRDSIGVSVRDPLSAYLSSLFPRIGKWKMAEKLGFAPFRAGADLWRRGLVAAKVKGAWRLYHPHRTEPAQSFAVKEART